MAGTIRKRSWQTRKGEEKSAWVADYFDQNRNRHTKQFQTKKAADAWLLRARGEVRDGTHTPESASLTIAEAGELYLKRCALDGLERGSQRAYEQLLRRCINPEIGAIRLARLTAPSVIEFRDALLEKVSHIRARRALSLLKTVITHAQNRGLVAQNVALSVRVGERRRLQEKLAVGRTIPTQAEMRAILDATAADAGWPRVMLLCAAFTGLREGELRGLAWEDVNFAEQAVTVRQRADQWGALGPPKTAAGRRTVPIGAMVVSELRRWRLACPGPMVFPGQGVGTVLSPAGVLLRFWRVQREAGIVDAAGEPKYVFHALRHFYASVMIALGYGSKWLQVAMGHEKIELTLGTYGHLFPDHDGDRQKVAAFEAAVLGGAPSP
jgi:integrase